MILAIDVQYSESTAFVAGVLFVNWCAESSEGEFVSILEGVMEYKPGSFYKRELPCILRLIQEHDLKPEIIVIDGYVFLDEEQRPGLGKHLFDSLEGRIEVVGVAKRSFSGVGECHEVLRGESVKPLYITTTGSLEEAKANIASMFGEHRIPFLLKRADQLCREEAKKQNSP